MSEQATGGAFYQPQRWNLWRWLGFGTPGRASPEEHPEFAPGWLVTETRVLLDWRGRLRVLLSGKVMVLVYTQTDVAVRRARSLSSVGVLPPGYRVPQP